MPAVALRTATHDDETWQSYLSRSAAAHQCTLHSLARHIGLLHNDRWPGYHGVILAPDRVTTVARHLGITPDDVDVMHLARYDQRAFDLTGLFDHDGRRRIDGTRRVAHQGWVFLAGSRYCPTCLSEDGIWRLSWRLPWVLTCACHHTWLRHTCPGCGGTPGLYTALHASAPSRATSRPDTRQCDLPALHRAPGTCGADLTSGDPPPAPPETIGASATFEQTIARGHGAVHGTDYPSLETLRAWQSAIGIAVALGRTPTIDWGRTHRRGTPPRDPAVMANLVMTVQPLLNAATPDEAADTLQRWCRDAGIRSPHADTFGRVTAPSTALAPAITTALQRTGRVHILLTRERLIAQQQLPVQDWTVDDVPQLVWPCALPPQRRSSRKPDALILRAVTALVLTRIHDGHAWADAGARLGISPAKARQWTRYCFSSAFPGLRSDLLAAARTMSTQLADQPERAAWANHPVLPDEYGLLSLRGAQDAQCRRVDPTSPWCPCTVPKRSP